MADKSERPRLTILKGEVVLSGKDRCRFKLIISNLSDIEAEGVGACIGIVPQSLDCDILLLSSSNMGLIEGRGIRVWDGPEFIREPDKTPKASYLIVTLACSYHTDTMPGQLRHDVFLSWDGCVPCDEPVQLRLTNPREHSRLVPFVNSSKTVAVPGVTRLPGTGPAPRD